MAAFHVPLHRVLWRLHTSLRMYATSTAGGRTLLQHDLHAQALLYAKQQKAQQERRAAWRRSQRAREAQHAARRHMHVHLHMHATHSPLQHPESAKQKRNWEQGAAPGRTMPRQQHRSSAPRPPHTSASATCPARISERCDVENITY